MLLSDDYMLAAVEEFTWRTCRSSPEIRFLLAHKCQGSLDFCVSELSRRGTPAGLQSISWEEETCSFAALINSFFPRSFSLLVLSAALPISSRWYVFLLQLLFTIFRCFQIWPHSPRTAQISQGGSLVWTRMEKQTFVGFVFALLRFFLTN